MKKLLLILLVLSFACKKEEKPEYSLILTVEGSANYQYQIGSEINSGHASGVKEIIGMAHDGDYVSISAQADSASLPVKVKFNCDIAGIHRDQVGGDVTLFKQF